MDKASAVDTKKSRQEDVIEILSDDDDGDDDGDEKKQEPPAQLTSSITTMTAPLSKPKEKPNKRKAPPKKTQESSTNTNSSKELQAGLVLEEDVDSYHPDSSNEESSQPTMTAKMYIQQQQQQAAAGNQPILYHDTEFQAIPSSIDGLNKKAIEKCRCSPAQPVLLSYKTKEGPNKGRPFYHCASRSNTKCNFFKWAFNSESLHWYRFGHHNNHVLVRRDRDQQRGLFVADDLLQGKVGDCWFLSALAVIAERPDLIMRLFGNGNGNGKEDLLVLNEYGIVEITLFVDGFWKKIVIDNFLPCIVDDKAEDELQRAIQASMSTSMGSVARRLGDSSTSPNNYENLTSNSNKASASSYSSSKYDPHALSDKNREVLMATTEFLQQDQEKKNPLDTNYRINAAPRKLGRLTQSDDLAYSKAKQNQLWVPLLEKAYAKSHGCYQAISGGQIAEAFLDLTGAPTKVYNFDASDFEATSFWYKLLSYRKQRLPTGCGTSTSAAGIIGMHAYSILDVREIRGVSVEFFKDKLLTGTLGNVSGFTEFDGTVRLLRIRNPHGKGEWKGEFSDNSDTWQKLLEHQGGDDAATTATAAALNSPGLQRTMKNDGCFWIDYDNFLMGFSNVDVVLAFLGNHAKSFESNFPAKKSNHRCTRAFEVSLLDKQPGLASRDTVELYIMGIQKTRRGASHGRSDRKKSYKLCDLGMIVGENRTGGDGSAADNIEFDSVNGEMFGFRRNGHFRLILDRKKNKSLIVMPISFGHPAATDKALSFVLRFVADAPLLIRELPCAPRMDRVLQKFCLNQNQGRKKVLLDDSSEQTYSEPLFRVLQIDYLANRGGTVFLYLCVNDELVQRTRGKDFCVSFSMEATCRGMMCRTEDGFLPHETVSKGKKFEAAWRRYSCEFKNERKSRLLMVLVQSGQDAEMGAVNVVRLADDGRKENSCKSVANYFPVAPDTNGSSATSKKVEHDEYETLGVFNATDLAGSSFSGFSQIGVTVADTLDQRVGGHQHTFDLDLERALALSRGDLEIQEVLERSQKDVKQPSVASRNHDDVSGANFDQDLERAILASTKPQMTFSQELEKAMRLSLQESKRPSMVSYGGLGSDSMVDLVSCKQDVKRRKTDPEMVEIIDNLHAETAPGKGSESRKEGMVTQDERRKLTAEAAMKRFQAIKK
jgi:hypothetical protein